MVAEPTSGFGQLDFREDDGRRGGWPCDDGHLELHGKISLISASQGPGARNRAGENKHRDANGSSWFPESSQQEAEASEVPKAGESQRGGMEGTLRDRQENGARK